MLPALFACNSLSALLGSHACLYGVKIVVICQKKALMAKILGVFMVGVLTTEVARSSDADTM
jgi:hypothetical protein